MSKNIIANLTEIKTDQSVVTVGMDALIGNSLWGKVEKITSAWGGTIFVRVYPDSPLRKFTTSRSERTNDSWHCVYASFHTPEQKCAIISYYKNEKERQKKAYQLQAIEWIHAPLDFITSAYNLAVEKGQIVEKPLDKS